MTSEPPLNPEPPAPPPTGVPPQRYPFWGYTDLLLFLGMAAPCMLMGFAVAKAVMWTFRLQAPNRAVEVLAGQFAGYAFLFAAMMLILRLQHGLPFWRSLGWTEPGIRFLWLVLSGFAMAFIVAMIASLIRTPTTTTPLMELLKDRASVILMAAFGITIGPLCEELIFRGFLQPVLVRSLGAAPGIIATALPFGLLHYQEYGNSWRHVVLISVAGMGFGWMRHATGSTKASTIMHAAYNGLFFVAFMVGQGGRAGR